MNFGKATKLFYLFGLIFVIFTSNMKLVKFLFTIKICQIRTIDLHIYFEFLEFWSTEQIIVNFGKAIKLLIFFFWLISVIFTLNVELVKFFVNVCQIRTIDRNINFEYSNHKWIFEG